MTLSEIKPIVDYYVKDYCAGKPNFKAYEIDEIQQNCLIRVNNKINLHDKSKPIKPWLKTLCTNYCRNFSRDKQWGVKPISLDKFVWLENGFESAHNIYSKPEIHNENYALLRESLTNTEIRLLDIFMAGAQVKRISALSGMHEQTIYAARKRIRAKYRDLLNRLELEIN